MFYCYCLCFVGGRCFASVSCAACYVFSWSVCVSCIDLFCYVLWFRVLIAGGHCLFFCCVGRVFAACYCNFLCFCVSVFMMTFFLMFFSVCRVFAGFVFMSWFCRVCLVIVVLDGFPCLSFVCALACYCYCLYFLGGRCLNLLLLLCCVLACLFVMS